MYIVILFILLFIYIFTKIRIKILNINDDTDVIISIGVIKIHIDYDMFMKEVNKITKKAEFSFKQLKQGFGFYNIFKDIFKKSNIVIHNANIVKKNNTYTVTDIYLNITYYSLYNYIKTFLVNNTKKQENISFYIMASKQSDIDINIDFEFSLFLFINSIILNIKNIKKIKRI